jgi:hypothetical protein
MTSKEVIELTRRLALQEGIDPDLAVAICGQESNYVTGRVRYEKNWSYLINVGKYAQLLGITIDSETQLQKFSYNGMQVMGSVARELGFNSHLVELVYPELGLLYGCKKLKQLSKKYLYLDDLISSYNGGSPVKIGSDYRNQRYVTEVKLRLIKIKGP